MTGVKEGGFSLRGERVSPVLIAILAVVGLGMGTADVLLIGRNRQAVAATTTAVPPPAVVTITKLPELGATLPAARPVAPAETDTKVATPKAVDCAPLFAVTFSLGGAVPMYDGSALTALVEWLKSHRETNLIVDGHSDSSGSAATNLALSHRRASEMSRRFVAAGLSAERITRRAFGNYTPVVGTREDSPKNRRVVLSVAGMKDCPELESP